MDFMNKGEQSTNHLYAFIETFQLSTKIIFPQSIKIGTHANQWNPQYYLVYTSCVSENSGFNRDVGDFQQ